jgi:hypothetical protein
MFVSFALQPKSARTVCLFLTTIASCNRIGDDTPCIALEGKNRSERRSLAYAKACRISELSRQDLVGQMVLEC